MGSKNKLSMLSHMFPLEIAIWGYPCYLGVPHFQKNPHGCEHPGAWATPDQIGWERDRKKLIERSQYSFQTI